MKTKLLTAFLFLIATSTQTLAARPSIIGLQQQVNELESEVTNLRNEVDVLTPLADQRCPKGDVVMGTDGSGAFVCVPLGQQQINQLDQRVTSLEDRVTALEAGECPPSTPTRFTDNHDGTICDSLTGLMWEKKDSFDGTEDYDNPHDSDNEYTWAAIVGGTNSDGTVFTSFLAQLNGNATDDPNTAGIGFAGYTDWRLPNTVELQTLHFEPYPCSITPCIVDQVFSPTSPTPYWTSTSYSGAPSSAWFVSFNVNNGMDFFPKTNDYRVRAVRNGR